MGVLTQDMRDILASAMLAFVATVRRDGSPSLSPKSSTIPYDDDHLLFVDIASPQTIANLRNNPRIEINSFDFIRRRGYRFAGTARCLNPVIRSTTGGGPGY
jgi:predicted pyridoxine 5'-phosphate oxidase superfamily flavin-nucleotide-binding protein